MDSKSKINEALELALAAIDKETIPQLQQQQQQPQQPLLPQPEILYPITAPSSNTNHNNTYSKNNNNNNNNNKQINNNIVDEEIDKELHQQPTTLAVEKNEEILLNTTDEEKYKKLNLEIQLEKSEEEILKEPIYENIINSTTSMTEVDVALMKSTTTTTTTATLIHQQQPQPQPQPQQQQQQQQSQIIPSMIVNNNENSSSNNQLQNKNLNQNLSKSTATKQFVPTSSFLASNQLNNSQINNLNCQNNNNNNNNSNSSRNKNFSKNNENNKNFNIKNIDELTNAFANNTTTITTATIKTTNLKINANTTTTTTTTTTTQLPTPTTTATATVTTTAMTTTAISSDLYPTVNNTTNSNTNKNLHFKEINFNQQTNITSSSLKTCSSSTNLHKTESKAEEMFTEQQQQQQQQQQNSQPQLQQQQQEQDNISEPYYQVPKSNEPYYDAPKHLKPVPVYENIEVFFNGNLGSDLNPHLQPPKEKPPPPPVDSPPLFDDVDSSCHTDTWSSDNTYETLTRHQTNHHHHLSPDHPSPPIKRMNSTKRIKKELRHKRSSFLGIEGSSLDDDESYLELTVAPPPDMAQLLQEERRLEKQLYLKAGLCDSSDTGESRDSGVSENHSRQSSEHYTNSSEENEPHDDTTSPLTLQTQTDNQPNGMIYQNDGLLAVVPTPLLQTVKGNSAESWTESATVAAAATQSLTEATATANAKMMSIEEKIREQEEVLRVERELLQLEQEELKRQRENLMLRENMARRELQHGAKMLMSANRRSLQDLNGLGALSVVNIGDNQLPTNNMDIYHQQMALGLQASQGQQHRTSQPQLAQPQQLQSKQPQQIYANIPNLQQQYYHMETDYRKSMSDINEFSKRMMSQPIPPPAPPSKPMRAMHINTANMNGVIHSNTEQNDYASRQRHSLNTQQFGGSLVKIAATPTAAPRAPTHIYSNYQHQSVQNLASIPATTQQQQVVTNVSQSLYPGNMSRNTLHALSATPKPKYTDGWVQVQQRKSYDSNLANDPAWLSAYQQKRKSMPDAYHGYNQNNHWLIQEAEQRRVNEQQQQQRRTISSNTTPVHQANSNNGKIANGSANGKPLPDSIIQTLTERVQSKGIGERKRTNLDKSPIHAASSYHQYQHQQQQQQQQYNKLNQLQQQTSTNTVVMHRHNNIMTTSSTTSVTTTCSTNGQSNINTTPQQQQQQQQQQDKVLSVSGKKKCSHCGDELGRGAAMIIESLLLFYHINCFKCCVCHVQLGDGLNGTDVRVRNHKLHCQNCYSSDDGIKFSCV